MARRANPRPRPAAADFLTGQLLIAMPAMEDPRFAQSVIYLCAHTPEGAMGLVLNRPLQRPKFDELLDSSTWRPCRRPAASGCVPAARWTMREASCCTPPTGPARAACASTDGLALTASLDVLKAIAEGGGPREGLLALGYAGWGPGQLDAEIQQNAWLSVPADETIVFDGDHDTKWRRALGKLKIDPLLLSGAAGHA